MKGAAVLVGLATLAAIVVLVTPASAEVRFAWGVVVAVTFLTAGGAFLAHRTMQFARRTAAENLEMRTKLGQAAERLSAVEQGARETAAQQVANIAIAAQRAERYSSIALAKLQGKLDSLQETQDQIGDRVRSLANQLDNALHALRDQQATTEQAHAAELSHLARQMDVISVRLADLRSLHITDFSRLSVGIESATTRVANVVEKVKATQADLKQVRASMDDRHANMNQKVGELENRVTADHAIASRTASEIASLDRFARSLSERMAAVTAQSADLDKALAALESSIMADRGGAAGTNSKIASLDDLVRSLSGQVAQVDSRSAGFDAAIAALENKLADDRALALETGTKLATLDGLVQLLVEQLANTENGVAGLDSELVGLQGILAAERTTIARTVESIASLNSLVRCLPETVAAMEARNEGLSQAFSALEASLMADRAAATTTRVELASDRAAASALGAQVEALDLFAQLLAERIATMDDFAKQLYCDSQLADENARKIVTDMANLAVRIASVNVSVGGLADSHTEIRSDVSEIGCQLAEIAALSEQVVAQTASMLRDFEARLSGVPERTVPDLLPKREEVSNL